MTEVLMIIAIMCQTHGGVGAWASIFEQRKCQREVATCTEKEAKRLEGNHSQNWSMAVLKCMKEKK